MNPNDIDFITWIDWRIYESQSKDLKVLREKRFEHGSKLDGYILPFYPEQHRKGYLNEINEKQWLFDWAYDDDNRNKGLIKLKFYNYGKTTERP